MILLPYISTIVGFIFTGVVLARYLKRRGVHLLVWAFGLLCFSLGTLSEVLLSQNFNPLILKLWYLAGAMYTPAWLGTGTVYLLVRKGNIARNITIVVACVSMIAMALVFFAPITDHAYEIARPVSGQYKDILPRSGLMILITVLLNIYGASTLVGGAFYSAYIFWRKGVLRERMIGNIFIAIGALIPTTAGSFVGLGAIDWLYLSELLGGGLIFLGFLISTSGKTHEPQKETA